MIRASSAFVTYSTVRHAAISFSAALIVGVVVYALNGHIKSDSGLPKSTVDWMLFALTAVVASPIVETLMLAAVFMPSRRWLGTAGASYLAAALLALFHSVFSPLWGLVVAIPFIVFTHPFRKTAAGDSIRPAIVESAKIHAVHNAFALALLTAFWLFEVVAGIGLPLPR